MSGRGGRKKKRGAKTQDPGQSQNVTPDTEKPSRDESGSNAVKEGSAAPESQSPEGEKQIEATLAEDSTESAAVSSMQPTPESPVSESTRDDEKARPSKRFRTDLHTDVRVLLPSKVSGAIIGKGGVNIKRLRNDYNTSINFLESQGPERVLSISANVDSVCLTMRDVLLTIAQQWNLGDTDNEIRVLIHQSQIGQLIGKGGTKIKEIQQETGSKIKLYMDCAPYSLEKIVEIRGSVQQIVHVIGTVCETMDGVKPNVAGHYNPNNFDPVNVLCYGGYVGDVARQRQSGNTSGMGTDASMKKLAEVCIPQELAAAIVNDSKHIQRIEQESKSKIKHFARTDTVEHIISITGTREQILRAHYLLQMVIQRHFASS